MVFQYSSPVRRNGKGENLDPFPNEIYAEILHYVQPDRQDNAEYHRQLSKIALVCRYFCFLMVPRLFDTLIFDGSTEAKGPTPNYSGFCRSIIKDEGQARELAKYVRTCRVLNWLPDEGFGQISSAAASFLKLHFSAMVFMENLSSLIIDKIILTSQILRALSELKKLKHLELTDFKDMKGCRAGDYKKLASLRLTTLKMHNSNDEPAFDWDDYKRLGQAFDYSHLETLLTSIPSSVTVIQKSSHPSPLRTLELKLYNLQEVTLDTSLFHRLPELRRFEIAPTGHNQLAGVVLKPSDIPLLEDVECLPDHLALFVPGRPVSRVTITLSPRSFQYAPQSPAFLEPLARSTAAAINLSLPFTWFALYIEAAHGYLAKVNKLRLFCLYRDLDTNPEILKTLATAIPMLPQIRHIQAETGPGWMGIIPTTFDKINLKEQEATLSGIPSSSKVEDLQLGLIKWSRDRDGRWTPSFHDELRDSLENQLEKVSNWSDYLERSDVEDYMKNLFASPT
ncbi:hypothetical protein DFP72DRAFT_1166243 [Ephemerocybe angulata]|uniref:F-box domain-containing protein n=1 Tax=Ephemerocybe angulata TaxID=980116 RepID=A0A8H6IB68_9AGAR|nr:hypothetical protein DFP72DRAFT_1166243 [Tulosesus angulatus]